MSEWFTSARSTAARFRTNVGSSAALRAESPVLVRAISITVLVVMLVLAAAIVIPLMLIGGVVFLAVLAALKARQLVMGGLRAVLPRSDGRRNVRVRLPAE